jgi:uncharacterized protein (TIGR03663 family)
MNRWIPLLILAIAAFFRFYALDLKPPHFDEGVNGWFIDQMTRTGYFQYDPENYHGPLHFYILFISQTLFGRNLQALRVPLGLASLATVWLMTRFDRFIDRRVCWFAAAAMAVSPAFTFYARYAIHESEMVFFLIMLFFGAAGLWKYGERKYLWFSGAALTGMILTKETYLVHLCSFALAIASLRLLELISPSYGWREMAAQKWSRKDLGYVTAAGGGAILFFYSGGFLDFPALRGLYLTFAAWARTGHEGHGHDKPWYYWLDLAVRYEWPVVAGIGAAALAVVPRVDRLLRLLSIYGLGTLVAFSIIKYKTPWCIISVAWPFFFTFAALILIPRRRIWRIAAGAAALILLVVSFFQAWRLNFVNYVNDAEPYVYVQTFEDINKLTVPLAALTRDDPSKFHITGHMLIGSYHPLPWVLGDFDNIGYYGAEKSPAKFDADFLIVDEARVPEVESKLKEPYFKESFKLRSAQGPAELYLNAVTFLEVFPGREPEFVPEVSQ